MLTITKPQNPLDVGAGPSNSSHFKKLKRRILHYDNKTSGSTYMDKIVKGLHQWQRGQQDIKIGFEHTEREEDRTPNILKRYPTTHDYELPAKINLH